MHRVLEAVDPDFERRVGCAEEEERASWQGCSGNGSVGAGWEERTAGPAAGGTLRPACGRTCLQLTLVGSSPVSESLPPRGPAHCRAPVGTCSFYTLSPSRPATPTSSTCRGHPLLGPGQEWLPGGRGRQIKPPLLAGCLLHRDSLKDMHGLCRGLTLLPHAPLCQSADGHRPPGIRGSGPGSTALMSGPQCPAA